MKGMSGYWLLLLIPAVLYLLGRYLIWLPSRNSRWPRLLMLHRVTPDVPASGMNMPPHRFEKMLRVLQAKSYHFVTVSEMLDMDSAEGCLALTFDDGFADNYQHAYPLLKKYGIKATIYLAPDIEGIDKLSSEQIREMSESGLVEFGAHTLHHVNLTTLGEEDAVKEITASKQRVTELAGSCRSFAYPFGRFSAEHEAMVRDAGYDSAVSTRKKIEQIGKENRFRLPRISTNGVMDGMQLRIALAKGRYRI
jgi:peptidoglycan/xylan/chitin deacetylase (PgdA/CDA1 family)